MKLSRYFLLVIGISVNLGVAVAQTDRTAERIDWGGGYLGGPDPMRSTPSTSGDGKTPQQATAAIKPGAEEQCARLAAYSVARSVENKSRERFANIPYASTAVLKAAIIPAERDLPLLCQVNGIVSPNINFELRLPVDKWNGKFMHFGCGGACGVVYRTQTEEPLTRGYAVVASDMGHSGAPNVFSLFTSDLLSVIDFGYRATHVVTLAAKEIVDEYYGSKPKKSYYMGCSTGGVQGVIEAQRYPYDFDGVLVGAPAYSSGPSYWEWGVRANLDASGNPILVPAKLPMIRKAVLAACDANDGLKDGLLQDPTGCQWDPKALLCKAGQAGKDCLSAEEINVVRKIYSGPMDSQGHSLSYGPAGMSKSSEYVWAPGLIKDGPPTGFTNSHSYLDHHIYSPTPANTGKLYNYDVDPKRGNIFFGGEILQWMRYAGNPDLRRFRDGGAKMIMYHGWDDNEVAPGASVDYYDITSRAMGGEAATQSFFQLYMMPGVAHCRRGPGADSVDFLTALENWVEKGQAPEALTSYHLKTEQNYLGLPRPRFPLDPALTDWNRPLYPYPYYARYKGKGDPKDTAAWEKARLTVAGGEKKK